MSHTHIALKELHKKLDVTVQDCLRVDVKGRL